tara:strand:- start:236 stop:415 length:180 start_codon:yes stop_codon:yes gene_type:complete
MSKKSVHKKLRVKVKSLEEVRNHSRDYKSWQDLKVAKKEKLKAKDKLYAERRTDVFGSG